MCTTFTSTLDTVAPMRLKKVREKNTVPWYNNITHAIKRETRNLERKWRQTRLEVFRIAWKDSSSRYRKTRKAARAEHLRKLIENNQNNPRFLFSTVARLTNKQTSPEQNISLQFSSDDFMNFFTCKIDNIREKIITMQPSTTVLHQTLCYTPPHRNNYINSLQ